MLTVMFYVAIALLLFLCLGAGVSSLFVSSRFDSDKLLARPLSFSVALSTGLSLVSLASLWSFGFFGLRLFGLIFLLFSIFSIFGYFKRRSFFSYPDSVNGTNTLSFLGLFTLVLFLAHPYIDSLWLSRITGGFGPDLTQNLMAIEAANGFGGTWYDLKAEFLVGHSSLYASYEKLFDVSSMQHQAFLDYLLFGTRWGFTIPLSQFSQQLDHFFPHVQAFSFVMGFALGAITLYSYLRAIEISNKKSFMFSILLVSNSSLLIQFFNGGLAQIWALPSLVGVLCYFHFRFLISLGSANLDKHIRLLFLTSTVNLIAIYVDGLVGICAVLLPILFVCSFNSTIRAKIRISLKSDALLFVYILVLTAPIIPPLLETAKLRSELAPWTGIDYPNWMSPLELFGLSNDWIWGRNSQNLIIQLAIVILVCCSGVLYFKKFKLSADMISICILILLLCFVYFIGLVVATQGSESNYTFVKISGYVLPLALILFAVAFSPSKGTLYAKIFNLFLVLFSSVSLISGISTSNAIVSRSSYSLTSNQMEILQDSNAQHELSEFNYITNYTPHSNLLGVFGEVHWISRPPNGLNVGERVTREIRAICLAVDNSCKPQGVEVSPSSLNKYGYRVYKVSNDSIIFQNLSPEERYKFNFEKVGQTPFTIPPEFVGTFRFR